MKVNIAKIALWKLCGLTIIALLGIVIMLLWNWLLPDIFGFSGINFWQALGLFALVRILFGNFGGGRHWLGAHIHHNPIREKWMKMTPEERKEFIRKRHDFHHRHHRHYFDFWVDGGFGVDENDMPTKENE
jgi:hypothetical protein